MLDDKDIEKLSEVFVTKEDIKDFVKLSDLAQFKSEILTGQDQIMVKLDKLLQEKTMGDEQDNRKTKVLEIHNNALKKNKILSDTEVSEIDKLRVF